MHIFTVFITSEILKKNTLKLLNNPIKKGINNKNVFLLINFLFNNHFYVDKYFLIINRIT